MNSQALRSFPRLYDGFTKLGHCEIAVRSLRPLSYLAANNGLPQAEHRHDVRKAMLEDTIQPNVLSKHNELFVSAEEVSEQSRLSSRRNDGIPINLGNPGDHPRRFDLVFLRDICTCSSCVDPSTSQKLFDTADIPRGLKVRECQTLPDGNIAVKWYNDIPGFDDHTSTYSLDLLRKSYDARVRFQSVSVLPRKFLWDSRRMVEKRREVQYDDYINTKEGLHRTLNELERHGIVFLNSVPSDPTTIETIAHRIGPLRNTFYGSTWDVRSVPSAKNVAYTSQDLGFHMDLLYMANPPGLQILHSIKASRQGGESLFSDGFRALSKMDSNQLRPLFYYPVTYRYKNDGHWYQQTRPTIEGDIAELGRNVNPRSPFPSLPDQRSYGEAVVNWSPPFQGPFEDDLDKPYAAGFKVSTLRSYIHSAKIFKDFIEAEDAVYETKMEGGTCVIFDNRRVLHARKAFGGGAGERWLRGAYVDKDPFKSRLRVLNEELGTPSH